LENKFPDTWMPTTLVSDSNVEADDLENKEWTVT
jgi:hypothetical protein